MTGKNKCKLLKEIRREIARQNDIAFVTADCKFQGNCTGTCPKCEAEVRYLEAELAKRQRAGQAIAVAGLAAALLAGCAPKPSAPAVQPSGVAVQPSDETTTEPTTTEPTTTEPGTTELTPPGALPGDEFSDLMGEPLVDGEMDYTQPTETTDWEDMVTMGVPVPETLTGDINPDSWEDLPQEP